MKTLFVNPHLPKTKLGEYAKDYPKTLPVGLAYVAAVLEKEHDVRVLDNNLEGYPLDEFKDKIRTVRPEIVGLSAMSIVFDSAIELADAVKDVDPSIVTVIGGSHANAWPEYPLRFDCFDYVVHGEGELTVNELWNKLEKGESVRDVQGIALRDDGKPRVNERRPLIQDLDSLPWPARHLFPFTRYERREIGVGVVPVDSVVTSRGCPFRCAFCSAKNIFGRGYRFRSADNVLDEIAHVQEKYGSKGIYFREDNFTANVPRVSEISRKIKERGMHFAWACESRVNTVTYETLKSMREAGCETIWFGVESGRQDTLDRIKKDITLEQVRKAFGWCRKLGIKTGASFIIGLPHEDLGMMKQTVDFACDLDPDSAWFNIFWGMPFSELYEEAREKGFVDEDLGHGVFTVKTPLFDRKKMEEFQHAAHKRFYSSPKRLLKKGARKIISGELSVREAWQRFKKLFLEPAKKKTFGTNRKSE